MKQKIKNTKYGDEKTLSPPLKHFWSRVRNRGSALATCGQRYSYGGDERLSYISTLLYCPQDHTQFLRAIHKTIPQDHWSLYHNTIDNFCRFISG